MYLQRPCLLTRLRYTTTGGGTYLIVAANEQIAGYEFDEVLLEIPRDLIYHINRQSNRLRLYNRVTLVACGTFALEQRVRGMHLDGVEIHGSVTFDSLHSVQRILAPSLLTSRG